MSALPKTSALGDDIPRCPWCDGFMYEATVKLSDAIDALMYAERAAYLTQLPVDCPDCGKPSVLDVVHRGDEQRSWLTGDRTPADKKLLGEPA